MTEEDATEQLCRHWQELSASDSLCPATAEVIADLIRRYGSKSIRTAMNLAWQEYSYRGESDAFLKVGVFARIGYETNRIPNARPLYYIRGIMRSRFGVIPEGDAMRFLRAADYAKVSIETLEAKAKSCRTYDDWVAFVQSRTGVKLQEKGRVFHNR